MTVFETAFALFGMIEGEVDEPPVDEDRARLDDAEVPRPRASRRVSLAVDDRLGRLRGHVPARLRRRQADACSCRSRSSASRSASRSASGCAPHGGCPGVAIAIGIATLVIALGLMAAVSTRALAIAALGLARLALVVGAASALAFGGLSLAALADPGSRARRRRVRAHRVLRPLARADRCVDVRARPALSARRALVTGAGGQDGSYLAESLLERGYEVVGVVRDARARIPTQLAARRARRGRSARPGCARARAPRSTAARGVQPRVAVVRAALVGAPGRDGRVRGRRRHVAARGGARGGRRHPRLPGVVERDLRRAGARCRRAKSTPLAPVTPYGVAKAYGHFIIGSYRRRYGLHASCGILYNHESPRRPATSSRARSRTRSPHLARRRRRACSSATSTRSATGATPCDSVEAMRLMLQQDEPGDYVIATGELHSVRELVEVAFCARRPRLAGPRSRRRVAQARAGGAAPSRRRCVEGARAARLEADASTFEELVALLVDAATTT